MFRLKSLKLSVGIVALLPAIVFARGNPLVPARAAAMPHNPTLDPCSKSSCGSAWSVVPSDSPGSQGNELLAMASVAPGDMWAIGIAFGPTTDNTLIEHWNGTKWAAVSSPNVAGDLNELGGVAGTSANDVWAVGDYYDKTTNYNYTLIEHWNGTAWSIVPSPNEGTQWNLLHAMAAVSTNDVWAVGQYYANGTFEPLFEHWNGSVWSIVPSPNAPNSGTPLTAVSAISSTDVWAVGDYQTSAGTFTLIEHWNGTSWSIVSSPNPSTTANDLYGVGGSSSSDVWAVGYYSSGQYTTHSLIEHWNGTAWSVVSDSDPSGSGGGLLSVAAVAANDVWAVGRFAATNGIIQSLVEHWDGSVWSVAVSPPVFSDWYTLTAAVVSSASTIDAVGYYLDSHGIYQTLAEHYNMFSPLGAPVGSGFGPRPRHKSMCPIAVCAGSVSKVR